MKKGCVLLAEDYDKIVGFLNTEDDIIMSRRNFAMLDEIGAYITEEYRGKLFVSEAAKFCSDRNLPCAHADFETSNPYANNFLEKIL